MGLKLKNESGMILVTVIAFLIVMSILLAGFMSRNISTALSSEEQAKQIEAETLARGAYWKAQQAMLSGTFVSPMQWNEIMNGRTYQVKVTTSAQVHSPVARGMPDITPVNVLVTY